MTAFFRRPSLTRMAATSGLLLALLDLCPSAALALLMPNQPALGPQAPAPAMTSDTPRSDAVLPSPEGRMLLDTPRRLGKTVPPPVARA